MAKEQTCAGLGNADMQMQAGLQAARRVSPRHGKTSGHPLYLPGLVWTQ